MNLLSYHTYFPEHTMLLAVLYLFPFTYTALSTRNAFPTFVTT